MFRIRHTHRPAEAAHASSVIATTPTPHLLAPHARATREIAHARERTDSSSGDPDPPAVGWIAAPVPLPYTHPHRSTP
jgi:hypothetical protein